MQREDTISYHSLTSEPWRAGTGYYLLALVSTFSGLYTCGMLLLLFDSRGYARLGVILLGGCGVVAQLLAITPGIIYTLRQHEMPLQKKSILLIPGLFGPIGSGVAVLLAFVLPSSGGC